MKNVAYCSRRRHCDFKNEENMCTARNGDICWFSYTPVTKPHLGVMPREIWNGKRQTDLANAMARYLEAGYNKISDSEVKK